MNDRRAEINFNCDGNKTWAVILFERDVNKAEQEFLRFDHPSLQLYIYRWCYEGVVCL